MDERTLKDVAEIIARKRINLTHEEARMPAERAVRFRKEQGRLPSLTSNDAWERQMGEVHLPDMVRRAPGVMPNEQVTDSAHELFQGGAISASTSSGCSTLGPNSCRRSVRHGRSTVCAGLRGLVGVRGSGLHVWDGAYICRLRSVNGRKST